jgi:hypothetical protein
VLAQMDVQSSNNCTAPPVEMKKQGLASTCALLGGGAECASGLCCAGVCSECCGSPNNLRLGADGGMVSGPPVTCPDTGKCEARAKTTVQFFGPEKAGVYQCDPGQHKRPAGAECILDDDCASGVCDGEAWTFTDANAAATCSLPPPPQASNCDVSSVHAGRCR